LIIICKEFHREKCKARIKKAGKESLLDIRSYKTEMIVRISDGWQLIKKGSEGVAQKIELWRALSAA